METVKRCGSCKHLAQHHEGPDCDPCYEHDRWEPRPVKLVDSPVALGHPLPNSAYVNMGELRCGTFNPQPTPMNTNPELAKALGSAVIKAQEKPAKASPNPKQAYGDKKPPVHLIHQIAQLHESAALHSGKRKYGENNYLETAVEAMTYVGAILRHLGQWVSGERVDQKELVHHLGAIRACTNILLTAEATGMLIDNRPRIDVGVPDINVTPCSYREATAETFAEVERTIEHLNKLYPELL